MVLDYKIIGGGLLLFVTIVIVIELVRLALSSITGYFNYAEVTYLQALSFTFLVGMFNYKYKGGLK